MQYKGQLEGFPQEIVEKMLNYQVQHGNKRDITVFEDTILRDVHNGGFKWDKTVEGHIFWCDIIHKKQFNIFFDKYPKQNNNMKQRFPFMLSPSDQLRIINIACSSWKEKLAELFGKYIVLDKSFDISEHYYKEMREACTKEQHILFDEIFGKNEECIPDGTPCLVTMDFSNYSLRYSNGKGEHYNNGKKTGDTFKWDNVIILNEEALKNLPVNE